MPKSHNFTFVSAECFTHCEIGMTVHKLSAPYVRNPLPISVISVLFIPSVETAKIFLDAKLPKPSFTLKGIKVYNEQENIKVTRELSTALKIKTKADICVASSAGNGKGIVTILFKDKFYTIETETQIEDFAKATLKEIERRKKEAVEKTIKFLKELMKE
ncbi:FeGP cofactor biosynthesis protein HcgF family protein [Desulfurobacterium atlanticum]|uniref:Uncharacterized protein, UPF0254 family n=1 Tax=Desulfurobacterium atlanticum TaxID=240169 RepID=A0A239A3X4_9BACT|nr:FeGP cofactor biosynthesis protein HcgF family protein [Desulfurobacterium atlanticum]SNR90345.1 Uncharacterized protein, UPF0254 family [Desulfurobacterium atlanticum]